MPNINTTTCLNARMNHYYFAGILLEKLNMQNHITIATRCVVRVIEHAFDVNGFRYIGSVSDLSEHRERTLQSRLERFHFSALNFGQSVTASEPYGNIEPIVV